MTPIVEKGKKGVPYTIKMKNKREYLICDVLRNERVTGFVKNTLCRSYENFFVTQKKEARELVERSFQLLAESQKKGVDIDDFIQTTSVISNDLFRKNDSQFWFSWLYSDYKKYIRPKEDFLSIKKYITGKRILDFGSGGGYFALYLEKKGYDVYTTDVLDYRISESSHLPFRRMYSPVDISYDRDFFDTVIIKTVLHHTEPRYLKSIVNKLAKCSKRILLKEDVTDIDATTIGVQESLRKQPELKEYLSLSLADRFNALVLFDYFGNVIAQGKPEMNLPFQFHSVEYYKTLFEKCNLQVVSNHLVGFEKNKLHGNCQVWFNCEKIK